MGRVGRQSKQRRDTLTSPLFADLPDPPPADELVELRGLRHPVWTEQKAKLIARYLQLFTYVTQHGTYIDGFAGQQNALAESGWAAELVLANLPWRLRRFYLCDNDPEQIAALHQLKDRQPQRRPKKDSKREIEILEGDFNNLVGQILATKRLDPATFCLLDQRTFECQWATVERLAQHPREGHKIELFYFLPIGWLTRAFVATTKNQAGIEAWWGRSDWVPLVDMQPHQKALAFQQRFVDLGYRFVRPFPIVDQNNGNRIMFYMILASDHPDALRLMWRAYDQAVRDIKGWEQLELLPA